MWAEPTTHPQAERIGSRKQHRKPGSVLNISSFKGEYLLRIYHYERPDMTRDQIMIYFGGHRAFRFMLQNVLQTVS